MAVYACQRSLTCAVRVSLAALSAFVCAAGVAIAEAAEQLGAEGSRVYLFTSFEEPATAGLRYLWSEDGLHWQRVPGVFLKPSVGGQLMRDPSLARGPDGTYHLVWTTNWRGDLGFGHASSRDLVHWSPQQFVPVMQGERTTVNVWAPEVYYDSQQQDFIVAWASTIPGRYPIGQEREDNNHRMYYTRTKDFKQFTPAKLFCEPGFSVIDAVIVPWGRNGGPAYKLVLKDNTRPVLALRVAEGDSPTGPWRNISEAITGFKSEGPTVAKVSGRWIIYFDQYGDYKYNAVATTDFESFDDLADEVQFPKGHKHGTVLEVSREELDRLLRAGAKQAGREAPEQTPESENETQGCLDRIHRGASGTSDYFSTRLAAPLVCYGGASSKRINRPLMRVKQNG